MRAVFLVLVFLFYFLMFSYSSSCFFLFSYYLRPAIPCSFSSDFRSGLLVFLVFALAMERYMLDRRYCIYARRYKREHRHTPPTVTRSAEAKKTTIAW